ncbi:gap junction protein alpha 9b [Xyrauchen texanus]|uniref:gap junction protein alpha 9b n=1 Tax=Xyrauchen texanus TaxID=154827 RepID=UPI002242B8E5|nr:gap junction protein alpha 9b [Xyrauchen texanus]
MGDWNFLGGILEEVHIHSTMVGKIWLTILFIFRMLVLGVAAEDVWNDEQSNFICNTEQPGCHNVCYDRAFPISLIRYWVLQVIFVSSPSLVYMGHAIYKLRVLEKERHCKRVALRRELETLDTELVEPRRRIERELRQLEQGKLNKAPLRGSLLRTYVVHIITRSVVEVSFMMGQYLLYGHHLEPLYKCDIDPCPNVVDCFISRPTEKSVFMVFMQGIAAVSLFFSLLEILHLAYKKLKKGIMDYYPHLKDDLGDYYGTKSKKNSVVHQVCLSQGRKATFPTVPGSFGSLLEKQGNGPMYPPLINPLSAFVPIQSHSGPSGPDIPRENKYVGPSPLEHNSNSNNTGSDTHSPLVHRRDAPERFPSVSLENDRSDFPTLPVMDMSLCPVVLRKPRRVSPPWNCSTVMEGNDSDSSGDSEAVNQGMRTCCGRAVSKSDVMRGSRTNTPDSVTELSSGSRHHSSIESPSFSPNRRTSFASNNSSRRAATDLQI